MIDEKKIRTAIIAIGVFVVTFTIGIIVFNRVLLRNFDDSTTELGGYSLPVMEICQGEDQTYNLMAPYEEDVELSLVRNYIAVADGDHNIDIRLHTGGYDITAIQYVLFDRNEEEPIAEGTLNKLEEDKDVKNATISLGSGLKQGKTSYLKLSVRTDTDTRFHFYTKVVLGTDYHLAEYMQFAQDFHDAIFRKEREDELALYLEPSGKSARDFSHVDIHSTTEDVFFGDMNVSKEGSDSFICHEINGTYGVIEIRTLISTEVSEGILQYYNMVETYKLRYTPERIFLLDYDRNLTAYYNPAIIDGSVNGLGIGINDPGSVDYILTDSAKKLCFVVNQQLWYYDYSNTDIYKVYSLPTENLGDYRNKLDDHDIKIISMDPSGNILYAVYGIFTRGNHQGRNGIELMRFNAAEHKSTEIGFFTSQVPFTSMKDDLNKLAYLNEKNVFYCLLGGDLHMVDLEEKEDIILKSGIVNEALTASKDNHLIAIEKAGSVRKNTAIELMDLNSGEKHTFEAEGSNRIHAVGFLSSDFIYGDVHAADIVRNSAGKLLVPMNRLHIADIYGAEVKTYKKSNRFIVDTKIKDNVLEMALYKRVARSFKDTGKVDYIRYKESNEVDDISFAMKYTEPFRNQVYIRMPAFIYVQNVPDEMFTAISELASGDEIKLNASGIIVKQYYVNASGVEQAAFGTLTEAIQYADKVRGNVVDSDEKTLWTCAFDSYAKVAGMDKVKKCKNNAASLGACLHMIAAENGKNIDGTDAARGDGKPEKLLEKCTDGEILNLRGISLTDVLYYIHLGSPVLARMQNGRYVVVMSYNSTKIRYLDPVTGQSTVTDREELEKSLGKAGNVFYSYV